MTELHPTRTDALLDELGVEVETKSGGAGRRARSASSRASRRSSGSSNSMGTRRSTGKIATSSSGSMPCASIVFVRWRSAAHLLEPLDHQGLLAGSSGRSGRRTRLDDDALLAELASMRRRQRTSPSFAMSAPRREASRRRDRQSAEMRGFRPLQAAVRAGAERDSTAACGRRDGSSASRKCSQGRFYILGGQKAYVAAMEEPFTRRSTVNIDARLRVIFDNGTESNLLMRSFQKRAATGSRPGGGSSSPSAGPLVRRPD